MRGILRQTTHADRILLVVLLLFSVSGIFLVREALPQSSEVLIEQDGRPVYSLSLVADKVVSLEGPCGETVIEVRGGRARVREAHCPNQVCVKQGWVERGVIVCLPNSIFVTVGGATGQRRKDIDAVTG